MWQMFIQKLSALFAALLIFLASIGLKPAGAPYQAQDEENVRLFAAVVSDLHTNSYLPHSRNKNVLQIFSGIAASRTPLDAVLLPGDLTEQAQSTEYLFLSAVIRRTIQQAAVLPATGNHDIRGVMGVPDYARTMREYYAFCASVGVQTEHPYWAQTVNGYLCVVLGSDDEVKDSAYISPAQQLWLDETLSGAPKDGRPVFLLCHQPLAHTNHVDENWPGAGTLGEQSDAVRAILQKHAEAGLPIVYLSGHLHQAFGAYSFESPAENLYCVNLPAAQYTDGGGEGVVLEAYADRVLLRTRNFISGEWLPDVYTIPLSVPADA